MFNLLIKLEVRVLSSMHDNRTCIYARIMKVSICMCGYHACLPARYNVCQPDIMF